MSDFDDLENLADQLAKKTTITNAAQANGRRSAMKRAARIAAEREQATVLRSGPTPSMPKFKCLEDQ